MGKVLHQDATQAAATHRAIQRGQESLTVLARVAGRHLGEAVHAVIGQGVGEAGGVVDALGQVAERVPVIAKSTPTPDLT